MSRHRSVWQSAPPGPPVCESHTYMLVPGSEWGWGQGGQTPHRSHWRSHPVIDKNINLYTCMFNQWDFQTPIYDQYNHSVLHIPFTMFELKRNFLSICSLQGVYWYLFFNLDLDMISLNLVHASAKFLSKDIQRFMTCIHLVL